MREHWESMLANKKWIKSEMDPKVCVVASWWRGSSCFDEWKEKKKNTHVCTAPDLCRYWYVFMLFIHIVLYNACLMYVLHNHTICVFFSESKLLWFGPQCHSRSFLEFAQKTHNSKTCPDDPYFLLYCLCLACY